MLESTANVFRNVGTRVVSAIWRLGYASRFFVSVLQRASGAKFSTLPT